jgi:hypothetical protein
MLNKILKCIFSLKNTIYTYFLKNQNQQSSINNKINQLNIIMWKKITSNSLKKKSIYFSHFNTIDFSNGFFLLKYTL